MYVRNYDIIQGSCRASGVDMGIKIERTYGAVPPLPSRPPHHFRLQKSGGSPTSAKKSTTISDPGEEPCVCSHRCGL